MDAELTAAEVWSFDECLSRLRGVAEETKFAKIEQLVSLVEELKQATPKRNLLTHSVWVEVGDKVVMQNFLTYHRNKWMFIKGDGKRYSPEGSQDWSLKELEDFCAHLHELSERLENIFQG